MYSYIILQENDQKFVSPPTLTHTYTSTYMSHKCFSLLDFFDLDKNYTFSWQNRKASEKIA